MYSLKRGLLDWGPGELPTASAVGSSHTITGLEEGKEYKVKVCARYDDGDNGTWSDESIITVAVSG